MDEKKSGQDLLGVPWSIAFVLVIMIGVVIFFTFQLSNETDVIEEKIDVVKEEKEALIKELNDLKETGPITVYHDGDADGFGDPSMPLTITGIVPEDYVKDMSDCNDNRDDIHPGAMEICGDGIDNNCDGMVPEPFVVYADMDGDHFGNPSILKNVCGTIPNGFVINSFDCNDGDTLINPKAQEISDNGVDDNCNGQIDEPS